MSISPDPVASSRSAMSRACASAGNSLGPTGPVASAHSQITRLSQIGGNPSRSSVGSLLSGFTCISPSCGIRGSAWVRTTVTCEASPFSCSATITLRT